MSSYTNNRKALTRFAWLSVAAAILTIALKGIAYFLTGSVGLLSDGLESIVNLVGALMALAMLTIAARPADEDHAYGHSKAEYFSINYFFLGCQEPFLVGTSQYHHLAGLIRFKVALVSK